MNRRMAPLMLLGILAVGLAGCTSGGVGGNGNQAPTDGTATTGSLSFSARFPDARASLIPAAAESIKVVVTREETGRLLATTLLTPDSPSDRIDNLPGGMDVTVTATAHPNADGTGTPEAQGILNAIVPVQDVAEVQLALATTVESVSVTPNPAHLKAGESVSLVPTARDADGSVVLVTTSWDFESADPTIAEVAASGSLSGLAQGMTTVSVTDTESGESASAVVGVWEPLICFSSERTGQSQICVMSPDGDGVTNVSDGSAWDLMPRWSPDGAHIVFVSGRDGNSELYTMDADGANVRRVTNNSVLDDIPDWSPDGSTIVFHKDVSGQNEIYTIGVDGTNETRLTDSPTDDSYATWSPDGSQIAFHSDRGHAGNWDIYVMDSDGLNQKAAIASPAVEEGPSWHPNGQKLIFDVYVGAYPNGNDEIYVAFLDGSDLQRLTVASGGDWHPVYSPEGDQIAFTAERNGNYEIYTMDAYGRDVTDITNDQAVDAHPDWRPPPW